jgi:hypothetical protein
MRERQASAVKDADDNAGDAVGHLMPRLMMMLMLNDGDDDDARQ